MFFLKCPHPRSNKSSKSKTTRSFFVQQQFLYSQPSLTDPTPYSSLHVAESKTPPISILIENLLSSTIKAYATLSFPISTENDPKWEPLCAKFGRFALFVDRKLASLAQDCRVVEDCYPSISDEELVAEVFRVLGEVLFLACEYFSSVQELNLRAVLYSEYLCR